MNRTDIINHLIERFKYKSYLEIGIDKAENFNKINISAKIAVDPNKATKEYYKHVINLTSNMFFSITAVKFDIIFIDGLHHNEQVYRDIINSLSHLKENGTIICHDMLPPSEKHQLVPRTQTAWNGDCWKAFVKIHAENKALEMFTVNTDYGCGIIRKGKQELIYPPPNPTFTDFVKNKKEWMNIISTEQFYEKFS